MASIGKTEMDGIIQYGLVGYPLGHSFSEKYFNEKFSREDIAGVSYELFPLRSIADLPALIAARPDLRGFNVTIPYKEQVIAYLDRIDPAAAEIGAVNCIAVREDGRLAGYNTDAPAFRHELLRLIGGDRPRVLILGTGGVSKAAAYILRQLGMDYITVSRKPGPGRFTYENLTPELTLRHKLIINTTPLGMHPDEKRCPPIPYDALTPEHYLFDMVYNPPHTEFLRRGGLRGAKTMNGYDMLVRQAELSWEIWMGKQAV